MKKIVFPPANSLINKIPQVEYHIHTDYTDGKNSVRDYVDLALNKNYETICFTEHVDKTTSWFDRFKEEVILIRDKLNNSALGIYYGIEVRAADLGGNLNAYEEIIQAAEVVMGVVHSYPTREGGKYNLAELTPKQAIEIEFTATMALLDNPVVDILGHPGHTYEKHFGAFPTGLYREIIRKAGQRSIAVEINPRYQLNLKAFLALCIEENVLVSLGSNCHSLEEFGRVQGELKGVFSRWN